MRQGGWGLGKEKLKVALFPLYPNFLPWWSWSNGCHYQLYSDDSNTCISSSDLSPEFPIPSYNYPFDISTGLLVDISKWRPLTKLFISPHSSSSFYLLFDYSLSFLLHIQLLRKSCLFSLKTYTECNHFTHLHIYQTSSHGITFFLVSMLPFLLLLPQFLTLHPLPPWDIRILIKLTNGFWSHFT